MVELLQKEESKFIARNLRVANMVLAAKNALDRELQRIVPLLQARLIGLMKTAASFGLALNRLQPIAYLPMQSCPSSMSGLGPKKASSGRK